MSFSPSYDPSMMPSRARGRGSPRFSSPRHQFSPGGERNHSTFNNRGFRTPNRNSRGRGRGCQYGDYQRDVQQFSPNYRSMSGSYQGSSPNCSFDSNLKRRMHSGRGLYHPSMLNDPWEGLSTEGKPMFRAANYISESFMSYCAKLQSKSSDNTTTDDSSSTTQSSSVSQLAANVSKLYDSFVSNGSQNIPGNVKDDIRPAKVSKTEPSTESSVESCTGTVNTQVEKEVEKEEVKSNVKDEESDDSDDGNIMF